MRHDTIGGQAEKFPTPNSAMAEQGLNQPDGRRGQTMLGAAVGQAWSTPRSEDSESCGNHPGSMDSLTGQTSNWPTPNAAPEAPTQEGIQSASPWGTPGAMDGGTIRRGAGRGNELLLAGQAKEFNWPTPDASVMNDRETPETFEARRAKLDDRSRNGKGAGTPLTIAAQQWATPRASAADQGNDKASAQRRSQGENTGLKDQASNFPTPTTQDAEQAGSPKREMLTNVAVSPRATPAARDTRSDQGQEGLLARDAHPRGKPLTRQILTSQIGLQDETPETPGQKSSDAGPGSRPLLRRRKLNPNFVEWLMGFPRGWSEALFSNGTPGYGPAEMPRYLSSQRRLLFNYLRRISSK